MKTKKFKKFKKKIDFFFFFISFFLFFCFKNPAAGKEKVWFPESPDFENSKLMSGRALDSTKETIMYDSNG